MVKKNLGLRFCSPWLFLVLVFVVTLSGKVGAAEGDSCECEPAACGECFEQQGVTFYTAKCDGGAKVKSCSRPTCVILDPLPGACGKFAAQAKEQGLQARRRPASASKRESFQSPTEIAIQKKEVGTVKVVRGLAWVVDDKGNKRKAEAGGAVHEGEALVTGKDTKLQMEFKDTNIINVSADSNVELKQVDYQERNEDKRTIINLIKGRVRNKVKQKYKGANSFYRVETRGAVAGVRGTDFVVSRLGDNGGSRDITKVETIEGAVAFAQRDSKDEVSINAGETASFVIAANTNSQVFDDQEIKEFIAKGYMTPVYKLTAQELQALDWETRIKDKETRSVASESQGGEDICDMPLAKLNQCSWRCENNPKGEKRCRTDLPQVNCVRTRCNANGEWAEESRMPASFYDICDANKVKVGPCDY